MISSLGTATLSWVRAHAVDILLLFIRGGLYIYIYMGGLHVYCVQYQIIFMVHLFPQVATFLWI